MREKDSLSVLIVAHVSNDHFDNCILRSLFLVCCCGVESIVGEALHQLPITCAYASISLFMLVQSSLSETIGLLAFICHLNAQCVHSWHCRLSSQVACLRRDLLSECVRHQPNFPTFMFSSLILSFCARSQRDAELTRHLRV